MSSTDDATYPLFAVFGPLALALIVAAIVYFVYAGNQSYNEAQAKIAIEAVKAGLVQNERGYWVEPVGHPRVIAEAPPKGKP
ncbi:MAG: hypothetical protein BWY85_00159 [Firmicutes bacterium ADurb.Bin506]|nr:MAG: hypothetical protein BWY85_00159 [Firmicutes bacterium ADurb.Bin506]